MRRRIVTLPRVVVTLLAILGAAVLGFSHPSVRTVEIRGAVRPSNASGVALAAVGPPDAPMGAVAVPAPEPEPPAPDALPMGEAVESSPRDTPPARAQTGGCCGPHSDAWWHGVAICEQGGRNDPYFGFFSFMDGSQGGKPWAEQVAAGNALLAAAGREVGPWAASCVAAGYASSPDG